MSIKKLKNWKHVRAVIMSRYIEIRTRIWNWTNVKQILNATRRLWKKKKFCILYILANPNSLLLLRRFLFGFVKLFGIAKLEMHRIRFERRYSNKKYVVPKRYSRTSLVRTSVICIANDLKETEVMSY